MEQETDIDESRISVSEANGLSATELNSEEPIDAHSAAVAMDYYILQDSSYNNRFNIFVALQGALLVFASLDAPMLVEGSFSVIAGVSVDTLIRLFGLTISGVWLYTQSKQTVILTHMREALPRFYPSLSKIVFDNAKRSFFPLSNFSVLNLLPWLFLSIWVFAVAESLNTTSEAPDAVRGTGADETLKTNGAEAVTALEETLLPSGEVAAEAELEEEASDDQ